MISLTGQPRNQTSLFKKASSLTFRIVKEGIVRYNHPCYFSSVRGTKAEVFRGSSAVERVAVNH